jgi:hypothetical protein
MFSADVLNAFICKIMASLISHAFRTVSRADCDELYLHHIFIESVFIRKPINIDSKQQLKEDPWPFSM